MYLVERRTKDESKFKFVTDMAKFAPALLEKAEAVEWWGTSFQDPGPDFNEFRLFDAAGKLIGTHFVDGY